MSGYVLKPRAQRDIEEIWDYSAATWDADQAELYIRQIQRALQLLAVDPRLGRACEDLRAGYRKFPSGSHLIFYRLLDDSIEVVRVLHERMDFDQHL
ncbi:MAG: type II toxin-antitoxin system RelE/ParE family toxin [Bradyrhizobium sp.]|nr:type II toxin-antitoxin system RelE/ParE family toxin [Bradyrhizobium sp.]